MFDLTGRNAFVTGGAAGIGQAVARAFMERGARVVIADIANAPETAAAMNTEGVHCDVSDEESVRSALKNACELLGGPLDVVVLNAGVGDVGPMLTESEQALIDKVTSINQTGVIYGLKHAPAVMNDGGAIITTSSMAAFINVPGNGIYAATKRAVLSLTEMAAVELGPRGIRVNSICPGYTDTAMGSGEEGRALCEQLTALGRGATVDDMTGVFVFLACDASRYMTGQALRVDGGWYGSLPLPLLQRITGLDHAPS